MQLLSFRVIFSTSYVPCLSIRISPTEGPSLSAWWRNNNPGTPSIFKPGIILVEVGYCGLGSWLRHEYLALFLWYQIQSRFPVCNRFSFPCILTLFSQHSYFLSPCRFSCDWITDYLENVYCSLTNSYLLCRFSRMSGILMHDHFFSISIQPSDPYFRGGGWEVRKLSKKTNQEPR